MKKEELFLFIWLVDFSSLWEPEKWDRRRQPQQSKSPIKLKQEDMIVPGRGRGSTDWLSRRMMKYTEKESRQSPETQASSLAGTVYDVHEID